MLPLLACVPAVSPPIAKERTLLQESAALAASDAGHVPAPAANTCTAANFLAATAENLCCRKTPPSTRVLPPMMPLSPRLPVPPPGFPAATAEKPLLAGNATLNAALVASAPADGDAPAAMACAPSCFPRHRCGGVSGAGERHSCNQCCCLFSRSRRECRRPSPHRRCRKKTPYRGSPL